MYYIGIDLGTSAAKLILMDETGKIENIVSREYPLEFPHPGWSQQNPEDWVKAVEEGVPELLKGFDAGKVAGIGAGGQMHGLVVLDEQDRVIRPAILWNDGRTSKEVDYLNQEIGMERLSAYTANIAFAGFTRAEASLDEKERAGAVSENREDHASEGLYQLCAVRRALHRRLRRFRDASVRREKQVLEQRNAGNLRRAGIADGKDL